MVMNSAPTGEIKYEIKNDTPIEEKKGSKLWLILLIISIVLIIAGVAFYFIRARKLKQQLDNSREALV